MEFKIGDKIEIPVTKSAGNYSLSCSGYTQALGDSKFGIIEKIDHSVYKIRFQAGKELMQFLKHYLKLHHTQDVDINSYEIY